MTIAGIGTSRIDSVRADRLPANHKDRTVAHARKIAVIGLGYVGLPVAVGFARNRRTCVSSRRANDAVGKKVTRECLRLTDAGGRRPSA